MTRITKSAPSFWQAQLKAGRQCHFDLAPMAAPRPRFGRNRTFMPAKYQAWKQAVRAMWGADTPRPVVWIGITLYNPRKQGDLDNYLKSVLDALSGLAFEDDCCSCVQKVTIEARWDRGEPSMSVAVEAP